MPCDPTGVLATACRQEETTRNTGSPGGAGAWPERELREEQARPCGVAERLVVAMKSGNAGGAKGPQFKEGARSGERPRRLGAGRMAGTPTDSAKGREAAEGAARKSEGIAQPPILCAV